MHERTRHVQNGECLPCNIFAYGSLTRTLRTIVAITSPTEYGKRSRTLHQQFKTYLWQNLFDGLTYTQTYTSGNWLLQNKTFARRTHTNTHAHAHTHTHTNNNALCRARLTHPCTYLRTNCIIVAHTHTHIHTEHIACKIQHCGARMATSKKHTPRRRKPHGVVPFVVFRCE